MTDAIKRLSTDYNVDDSDDEVSVFNERSSTATDHESKNDLDELNREKQQVQKLAQNESLHVKVWRRNVLLVLSLMCLLVTSLTYIFLTREDEEDFSTSFTLFAQTVSENIEFNVQGIWKATNGASELLSFEARNNNMSWPFVTLPAFDIYVQHTNARQQSELMSLIPFVQPSQIQDWNTYSVANQGWIQTGIDLARAGASYQHDHRGLDKIEEEIVIEPIPPFVYHQDFTTGEVVMDDGSEGTCCGPDFPITPLWQTSPAPTRTSIINYNAAAVERYHTLIANVRKSRSYSIGSAGSNPIADSLRSVAEHAAMHRIYTGSEDKMRNLTSEIPHTVVYVPVFEELHKSNSPVVAAVSTVITWDGFIRDILPPTVPDVYALLHNSCGQTFTFLINGPNVTFLGEGAFHETAFELYQFRIPVHEFIEQNEDNLNEGDCMYWYDLYPTKSFQDSYTTRTPIVFAIIVALSFLVMIGTFAVYDWTVVRKNNKIIDTAAQTSAIVSSMFPSSIRDRLFMNETGHTHTSFKEESGKTRLSSFLNTSNHPNADDTENNGINGNEFLLSKPIADLFPDTTVMFADLVGFTAWSSMREPSQVFILLETIYSAFDRIAKKRRIFKVETVGDCYVAVTGLPEPRRDHAVAMARFANECLVKLSELTRQLETVLGPDTGDLCMRVGMHSGPVTAGVLRGERSRFQLFGDTMNTASRMESTGKAGRIQVSQETADLIISAGKMNWLESRQDVVVAKGKGEVSTFWLNINAFAASEETNSSSGHGSNANTPTISEDKASSFAKVDPQLQEKTNRLIQWNVDVLARLLKQMIARRMSVNKPMKAKSLAFEAEVNKSHVNVVPLQEVVDIITLPKFDSKAAKHQLQPDEIQRDGKLEDELRNYISSVAMMYRDNPFHNFEHASHVTMSVVKLLSRIVAPIDFETDSKGGNENTMRAKYESTLHDHTYGITSDPLTQFSCVLSALVHDADHSGVPNAQLIEEKQSICSLYNNRSIAEQNSVDLAWELLMDPTYDNLRSVIYTNEAEMRRFRQLLVNSVMATDIMDKELGAQRKARWNVAFAQNQKCTELSQQETINRKATIVIEHLIQASDVAHTMQHWHIYRKWNERLYQELYKAYVEGRSKKDPAEFWYKGEIGFFDFYIIPLAKKLKDCGVFGVSSDEYLQYAEKNRKEWELKGEQIVAEMSEKIKTQFVKRGNNDNLNGSEHNYDKVATLAQMSEHSSHNKKGSAHNRKV